MGTRLELHNELLQLCDHAYYQPPSNDRMEYPCFRYRLSKVNKIPADNTAYLRHKSYLITYINLQVNDSIIDTMLDRFEYCRFDRHYVADNLHHYTFELFY